jgi:hypothetical protein
MLCSVLRIRDGYPRSRILIVFIPDPGSRIPDPGSNNSTKRGGGRQKIFTIVCSHRYHTIVNNFIFEPVKKIFLDKTLRIIVPYFLPKNFFIKLSDIWVWDPGSATRDPGSKGTASRIRKTAYAVLYRTISWAGCGTATRLSRQRTGISGFS